MKAGKMRKLAATGLVALIIFSLSSSPASASAETWQDRGAHAQAWVGETYIYVNVWKGLRRSSAGLVQRGTFLTCDVYHVEDGTLAHTYEEQIADSDFAVDPTLSTASLDTYASIGRISLQWTAEGEQEPSQIQLKKPFDPYVVMQGQYLRRESCSVFGTVLSWSLGPVIVFSDIYSHRATKAWVP